MGWRLTLIFSLGLGALRGWNLLDDRLSWVGRLWCLYLAFFNSCMVDISRLTTTLGAMSFYYHAKVFWKLNELFPSSSHLTFFLLTEIKIALT